MKTIEIRRHSLRDFEGGLSPAGRLVARRTGMDIGPFDLVLSSPLQRAIETAEAMGFEVARTDERLSSLAWAGLANWDLPAPALAYVMHEDRPQIADQIQAFVQEQASAIPDSGQMLAIAHSGIIEGITMGCVPDAALGAAFDYCEGVRLGLDGDVFSLVEVLRVRR